MRKPYVREMVQKAIEHFNGLATKKQIRDFVNQHWDDVNPGTLQAIIIMLTVNHPSRTHQPENNKPRLTNGGSTYDLLFQTNRYEVERYNPSNHGVWEIFINKSKKLGIRLATEAKPSTIYTPYDIIWFKNVTNSERGEAYLNQTNETFIMHFPNRHKQNVLSAAIGELILIYQRVHGEQAFTHLVTPVDTVMVVENDRPDYKYGRRVKMIARTTATDFIPVKSTFWRNLNLGGITQGNTCRIDNIKNLHNADEFRMDIWQHFDEYFVENEDVSRTTTIALIEELKLSNPGLTVEEGELKLVKHLVRERNKRIISEKKQQAINNNQLHCEVCAFSFPLTYNVNFIECHHIIPISTPGRNKETSLEDLALVCANCHRMLHTRIKGEFPSLEELAAIIGH